jgi:hypothetical protein
LSGYLYIIFLTLNGRATHENDVANLIGEGNSTVISAAKEHATRVFDFFIVSNNENRVIGDALLRHHPHVIVFDIIYDD